MSDKIRSAMATPTQREAASPPPLVSEPRDTAPNREAQVELAPAPSPVPSPAEQKGRVYFPHLDGLRFWAFLAIFVVHAVDSINVGVSSTPLYQALTKWARGGTIGVNFFFVLSGFLITYLLLSEQQKTRRIDVGAFYVRRALRIWPLYFACVAVGYLLRPGSVPGSPLPPLGYYLAFGANFAVIHGNALPAGQQWVEGTMLVLWSIGVEEQFYLAWPLLLGAVLPRDILVRGSRTQRGQGWRQEKTMWLMLGVCALSLAWRIWKRDDWDALYFHTLGVIGDMALGGVAAWKCFCDPRWPAFFARLSRGVIALGYLAALGFVLAQAHWKGVAWFNALNRPLLAGAAAFIIVEQCYATNSFYKCGRSRWLSRLGTYTYGLYCLHLFAIIAVQKALAKLHLDRHLWQMMVLQIPLALALSIAIAALSYHFFESPFLRLKRRFAHVQTT